MMGRIRGLAAAAVAAVALSGCATMPSTYYVENSRTYHQSYDAVWEKLVHYFASRNIQIKSIEKDSGIIYAEVTTFGDDVADCGHGGMWVPVARSALVNVFVTRSTQQPQVTVNTQFHEVRQFESSGTTVGCNSRGLIERSILDALG